MSNEIQQNSPFGRRLHEARLQAGIPQDKLGVMIGLDESCSSARMSRYENGIHSPSFNIVERIAYILNLPTAYFYCSDDVLAEITKLYFHASIENQSELLSCARNLNCTQQKL